MSPDDDHAAMEAAFRETARGRRFLDEYARRCRADDTRILMEAISRIERVVSAQPAPLDRSVASATPPMADGIASDVLDVAEGIQETAWAMREAGADPVLCDRLDGYAAAIYAGCAPRSRATDRHGAERAGTVLAAIERPVAAEGPGARPGDGAPSEAGLDVAAIARFLNVHEKDRPGARDNLRFLT